MEFTALGRICRAGKLALKDHRLGLAVGICNRNRREECLGVRMLRILADFLCISHFYDVSKIHNRYFVGDVFYNRKVVGNKYVGHTLFSLKLLEKIDYLRLNRYVKSRYWLVAYNQLGLYSESSRNTYSLALTTREFVRISVVMVRLKSASFHYASHVCGNLCLGNDFVYFDRFPNNISNRHTRRKRGIGVLEYKLKLCAQLVKFPAGNGGKVVILDIAV